MIWDLFFEEPEPDGPLQEWLTGKIEETYPWTEDSARKFLTDCLIDVRVAANDTDKYCALSMDAWSAFVAQITTDPVGEELVIPIIREVERWSRRVAAMQADELKLIQFSGIKGKPVK